MCKVANVGRFGVRQDWTFLSGLKVLGLGLLRVEVLEPGVPPLPP